MSPETIHQTPNNKALQDPLSGISSRSEKFKPRESSAHLSPETERPWVGSPRPHPHCLPQGLKMTPVASELKLGNTAFVTMGTLATSTARAGGWGYAPCSAVGQETAVMAGRAQELGRHCSSLLPESVTRMSTLLDPFPIQAIRVLSRAPCAI